MALNTVLALVVFGLLATWALPYIQDMVDHIRRRSRDAR